MSARLPSVSQILEIGQSFGMHLSYEDAESFRGLMKGPIASYGRIDELVPAAVAQRFRELHPDGRPGAPVSPQE